MVAEQKCHKTHKIFLYESESADNTLGINPSKYYS